MGLATSVLRLLVRKHRTQPWTGPVITLGVQDVPATYDELRRLFRDESCPCVEVRADERAPTTSRCLLQSGGEKFVHPRVFFRMLGLEGYDDVDFAAFEQPTRIHDFNEPIPNEWRGRYGLVVDGGTLEHVFDVRSALENVAALLRVGGDVLHVSPVSGWVNHGFYQMNPCLFFDYYGANGFSVVSADLVRLPRDPARLRERIEAYRHVEELIDLADDHAYRTLLVFRARKTADVPTRTPVQGYYRQYATQSVR